MHGTFTGRWGQFDKSQIQLSHTKLIFIVLFFIPVFALCQYSYPKVDGCKIINDLISDIKKNKTDFDTYKKHFDEHNEIEIVLEFEWCRNKNIKEDDCQTTLIEHLGDSSLSFTLVKLKSELMITKETFIRNCIPISDNDFASYYLISLNRNVYIFQFNKKFKGIYDIVSDDQRSIFFGDNLNHTFYKELFEKNLHEE